jgi:triphosphatase
MRAGIMIDMRSPVETEIKLLAASPAVLAQLRALPLLAGDEQSRVLTTAFFDTPDGALARAGATLRIRDDGRRKMQTFKLASSASASIARGEWQAEAKDGMLDTALFAGSARKALRKLAGGAALSAVALARVERTTRQLRFGDAQIEAAFDSGKVLAGEREEPVSELELELVKGRSEDLLRLAAQLPLGPDLMWSLRSKAERAGALALDQRAVARRAGPLLLSSRMSAAEGFQAIAWNCLRQLLLNTPIVIAAGEPEAVHQCRIAVRRLRTALTLFADILGSEDRDVLAAGFRAVTSALGAARDGHVLRERMAPAAREAGETGQELLNHLTAARDAGTRSAAEMLSSASFQQLVVQLAAWIEGGSWLAQVGESDPARPLPEFARHVLSRRHRKLRRVKQPLKDLSAAELHRIRIDAKKLRYALEFFASLNDRGAGTDTGKSKTQAKPLAKTLAGLQESLGDLNDLAVMTQRSDLFADLDPITAARLDAELASLSAVHEPSRRHLIRLAQKQLDQVRGAHRWWKDLKPRPG